MVVDGTRHALGGISTVSSDDFRKLLEDNGVHITGGLFGITNNVLKDDSIGDRQQTEHWSLEPWVGLYSCVNILGSSLNFHWQSPLFSRKEIAWLEHSPKQQPHLT